MSGHKRMRAMDHASITIDQEMVAKIHRLAICTDPVPTNDDAENLAYVVLDAALDAALLEFEGAGGLHEINPKTLKFGIFSGTANMRVEISEKMRASLERLAAAAGYEDGVPDLLLETVIPPDVLLDAVAMSLIRFQGLNRKQLGTVAAVSVEERQRHSDHAPDQWFVKNVLEKKGGKKS